MGFKLTWNDNNTGEDGHRVYKSSSPMDPNNLPTPLVDLGPDITSYVDGDVVDGNTYYYRVSAYVGSIERVSDELQILAQESSPPTSGLIFHPDFTDTTGGIITDITGNHNGTIFGNPSVVTDQYGTGLSLDGVGDYIEYGKILERIHRGLPYAVAIAVRVTAPLDTKAHQLLTCATSSTEVGFNIALDNRRVSGSLDLTDYAARCFIARGVNGSRVEGAWNRANFEGVIHHICMSDGNEHWIYEGDVLKNTEADIPFTGSEVASHITRIGTEPTVSNFANVVLYRMRVYDRVLTTQELKDIKNEVLY